ncbi:MAG: hypothetical protein WEB00_09825 [Dehalococcoidia bacterium]
MRTAFLAAVTGPTVALLALFAVLVALAPGAQAGPPPFLVNTNGDQPDMVAADGNCDVSADPGLQCTLRAAIEEADATGAHDIINFNFPGLAVTTILVGAGGLPVVSQPATIDGTTAGAGLVEIDGTSAGFQSGLVLSGGGSAIRGMVINRFLNHGVHIFNSPGSTVQLNRIGTDPTGTIPLGNGGHGVYIDDSNNNLISANVISGNAQHGVLIETGTATGNQISGNSIGTNAAANAPLGNAFAGIEIRAKGQKITGNVIGANGVDGISLGFPSVVVPDSDASNNIIQGNYIGTDATGTIDLGNALGGIVIRDDPANDNLIGGNETGEGNTIAFNDGVQSGIGSFNGTGNSILGNSIYDNGGPGIDFIPFGPNPNDPGDGDAGPNNGQNFPEIIAAFRLVNDTVIKFKLNSVPNQSYWIEAFANTSCDGSGNGEGKRWLGGSLLSLGASPTSVATFNYGVLNAGETKVTMTATLKAGPLDYTDTSEFSACFTPKTPKCRGQMLTQIGTNGPEFLTGTGGIDVISGRGGGDNISGLESGDIICGGSGDDIINGGPGNDAIDANSGMDDVHGNGGHDLIKGQGGEDTIDGDAGNDTLRGANGVDNLFGGTGADRLFGGASNDNLFGEAGPDELYGETGPADLCDGGTGTDTAAPSCDGNTVDIP